MAARIGVVVLFWRVLRVVHGLYITYEHHHNNFSHKKEDEREQGGEIQDMEPEEKVEPEEAESYASDNGIFFMETSAKTATNVNELFVAIGARACPSSLHAHERQAPGRARAAGRRRARADSWTDVPRACVHCCSSRSAQAAEELAAAAGGRPGARHCDGYSRLGNKEGVLLARKLSHPASHRGSRVRSRSVTIRRLVHGPPAAGGCGRARGVAPAGWCGSKE